MTEPMRIPLLAIVGPTASGKSAVGVALARMLDGEIVSADSMQVYRGMDIGTAKPSAGEQAQIRHHLIDVADPDEVFNVARYQELASAAIADTASRGHLPIMVGGTGLYVDAVVRGFLFPDEGRNPAVRARLEQEAAQSGGGAADLHARLTSCDPEAARKIHPNDLRRIVRTITEACHRHGLRVIEHMDLTIGYYDAYPLIWEHPDWLQVHAADMLTVHRIFCFNNEEFRAFYLDYARRFQRETGIDAWQMDEIQWLGRGYCGCAACREKWAREQGRPYPAVEGRQAR